MQINKMRCYFLYSVPVTESLQVDGAVLGVTIDLIEKLREKFEVRAVDPPKFYTNHYLQEHTRYTVSDNQLQHETTVSPKEIRQHPFYADLHISEPIKISWEFSLSLQSTGLITICLDVNEELYSHEVYRLSGLPLNPSYKVINTEPLAQLWAHQPKKRPDRITMDNLAVLLHEYFFRGVNRKARRFRALKHEIQIPFTTIEVSTDLNNQQEFVDKHREVLAELVFKPGCWEVEKPSRAHIDQVLDPERVWSVAQDTYFIAGYEGAVYVKLTDFDTGIAAENSGFYLADEAQVLYSYQTAVSMYHFLRILDDLLDHEVDRLRNSVNRYQRYLRKSFNMHDVADDNPILREMNDFVMQVTNLEFEIIEIMEEIDNPDKLIEDEWHIVLIDKLNEAFVIKSWRNSINSRINNLRKLVETVENTYQRLLDVDINQTLLRLSLENKRSEEIEKRIGYLFGVFAIAELLGLLINLGLDDNDPLVRMFYDRFGISLFVSHIISAIGVFILIAVLLWGIVYFVNRDERRAQQK